MTAKAIRGFVSIDLNRASAPDATTRLKFPSLMALKLRPQIVETIDSHLETQRLMMRTGTFVNAT